MGFQYPTAATQTAQQLEEAFWRRNPRCTKCGRHPVFDGSGVCASCTTDGLMQELKKLGEEPVKRRCCICDEEVSESAYDACDDCQNIRPEGKGNDWPSIAQFVRYPLRRKLALFELKRPELAEESNVDGSLATRLNILYVELVKNTVTREQVDRLRFARIRKKASNCISKGESDESR